MSVIRNMAVIAGDEFAIVDDRSQISWKEADLLLNRAINSILDAKLGPERRVAVFAENSAEVAIAHVAGILAGASMVPVSFHLTATELEYILRDSGATLLFVSPETVERGLAAAANVNLSRVIGWRCAEARGLTSWDAWLAEQSRDEPPTSLPPLPFLHYTSGTTGLPKGAEAPPSMFAGGATIDEHVENLRRKGGSVAALLSVNKDTQEQTNSGKATKPNLIVNPMYHTGALNSVRSLLTGTPLVILGRFDAEKTLAAISRYRVSGGVMVPTQFIRLLALPEDVKNRYDVSSLELVIHTGAACPQDVKRKMIDWWGPIFLESYGATEIGSTNAIDTREWLSHPGSVGRTILPFELLIIDDDGKELGPNKTGQICFRDTTGRGIIYYNDPAKTKSAHIRPGIFTLGEMGYCDEEGFVYITDRSSDMIVSGGVNIYPAEIEHVLLRHWAVLDCAVIGVPHDEFGEQVKALVVLRDPLAQPDTDELIEFCRQSLARYKLPTSIDYVLDVGRNSMGKINKRKLRAPYWPTERTIG